MIFCLSPLRTESCNQSLRDTLRLQGLSSLCAPEAVFSLSKQTIPLGNERHLSGSIISSRSVTESLANSGIRSIKCMYFDWIRMPSAYCSESMCTPELFTEVLPYLFKHNYLRSGSIVWIPGQQGIIDTLRQNQKNLIDNNVEISLEYDVHQNMLYRATAICTSSSERHQVFERLTQQDQYLWDESERKARFICLKLRTPESRSNSKWYARTWLDYYMELIESKMVINISYIKIYW